MTRKIFFSGPNVIAGTKGDDHLDGTSGDDIFLLGKGGNDTAKGMGGDDQFRFGGIALRVLGGHSYDLALDANSVGDGVKFNVDGSDLGSGDHLTVDVSAALNDNLFFFESGGDSNTFIMAVAQGGGGGGGHIFQDPPSNPQVASFSFSSVSDSTSTHFDTIVGFDFGHDNLYFPVDVSWQTPFFTSHSVDSTTFDADLAAAAGSAQLAVNDSCLVHVTGGSYSGEDFLVIDQNGTAGYQAGADIVIDVTGYTGLNS